MSSWYGSFLSAAWLGVGDFWCRLPTTLGRWQWTGMLETGTAYWLDLPPTKATYQAIMDGPDQSMEVWSAGVSRLVDIARHNTLDRLVLPFRWEHGSGEIAVHFMIFPDNSTGMYLNAPYQDIYEEQEPNIAHSNLARFTEAACLMFDPLTCLIGVMGEEAQVPPRSMLATASAELADWAFYGRELTALLRPTLSADLEAQARDLRHLPGGGLFVSWTEWIGQRMAPSDWRSAVEAALDQIESEAVQ